MTAPSVWPLPFTSWETLGQESGGEDSGRHRLGALSPGTTSLNIPSVFSTVLFLHPTVGGQDPTGTVSSSDSDHHSGNTHCSCFDAKEFLMTMSMALSFT